MARFSRADEKEADELGLRFMASAGYNPRGMLDMFQTLQAQEKSQPDRVSRFFLDHPLTQDRINDVSGRIGSMASSSGLITDEPEFHETNFIMHMFGAPGVAARLLTSPRAQRRVSAARREILRRLRGSG